MIVLRPRLVTRMCIKPPVITTENHAKQYEAEPIKVRDRQALSNSKLLCCLLSFRRQRSQTSTLTFLLFLGCSILFCQLSYACSWPLALALVVEEETALIFLSEAEFLQKGCQFNFSVLISSPTPILRSFDYKKVRQPSFAYYE